MREKKTILLVHDDLLVNIFEIFFRDINDKCQFTFAANGRAALDFVEENDCDLIITDIRMPKISGLELLKRLKSDELTKLIPVMLLISDHDRRLKRKALDLGADNFLNIPFKVSDKEDWASRINNLLLRGRVKAELFHYKDIKVTQEEMNNSWNKTPDDNDLIRIFGSENGNDAKEQVDRYKAICGSVAHSLKGEFLHIGFSTKQIKESAGISPEIQEECEIIDRSIAYSRVLLQQLLDYLDMGKPRMELIDTLELIKKTELLARPRLKSNITLNFIVTPNIKNHIIDGNFEQLMGILLELINNASNALLKKGGIIKLTIRERDGEIEISVSDNGCGIPPKIRGQLLKKQVPSLNGPGLGLFLSNKVIQELGGKLTLKSSSSKGTIFLLLLPKASDKKEV